MTGHPGDHARVRELLGREPRGDFEVVVRDERGDPLVLRNAPLLHDGTPMPTRYWLLGAEQQRIGRLEADGGVAEAEAAVDPDELVDAHRRYAAERDAALPAHHTGPRPAGGVGGTRTGVKCLHAHWAWHLAGGDDPVGRWIAERLETTDADDASEPAPVTEPADATEVSGTTGTTDAVEVTDATGTAETTDPGAGAPSGDVVVIGATSTTVELADGGRHDIPWGAENLTDRWLRADDPPRPEALTNALGAVDDHLDDVARELPEFEDVSDLTFAGPTVTTLGRVEVGADHVPATVELVRVAAEEIFRTLATESTRDRAANPGLPSGDVEVIVATCCIVLAVMRRLHLDRATLHTRAGG